MFITITGNVDPKEAINIIKENQKNKTFEEFKEIKTKKYDEPENTVKDFDSKKLNVSIQECLLAYKIKCKKDYKNLIYTLTLFDSKLSSTSKFTEELINDELINEPLILDYNMVDDYIVIFILGISTKPDEVLKRIKEEMKNLDVEEKDFERKKKNLISSSIYLSDNIFRLNHSIINDIIFYGKVNTNIYDDIKSLNYKDFNKVIKDLNLSNKTSFIIEKK